jgi:hydroxyacylglutathione hydrolase
MKIEQFEDKGLAQYSYAIVSEDAGEVVLIDPARDPKAYYDYAKANNSKIVGVILTHSHADFVSSHTEINRKTGARIFVSSHMEATFSHENVDEGAIISIGKIRLKALYTPGHSFDSICVLLEHDGKDKALFTGDTLFVGDVGRPDLRGNGDNAEKMRRKLAKAMYHTIHKVIKKLPTDIVIYPGHGAGTLCGKSLSSDSSSTIGREIRENYALQDRSEESFINILLENQSFIPPYFSFDVALNKTGVEDFEKNLSGIKQLKGSEEIDSNDIVVDTRSEKEFKRSHINGSINIQNGPKFETWLGTIIAPDKKFILLAKDHSQLDDVIRKAAKIGYETNIRGVVVEKTLGGRQSEVLNISDFKKNTSDYTIVDIRNPEESQEKIFENSINIPLPDLQAKVKEIPTDKPIVVHCAGGYRSAIGSSILENKLPGIKVFDLSEAVKGFQ